MPIIPRLPLPDRRFSQFLQFHLFFCCLGVDNGYNVTGRAATGRTERDGTTGEDTAMTAKQVLAAWRRWRRGCRCVRADGRRVKAWRVPGTQEAGREAMWWVAYQDAERAQRAACGV